MTANPDDMQAVVAALREHERFVVAAHENPDGDALGSLLAMHLALEQLGKESVMFVPGEAPLPGEYTFLALDGVHREPPPDHAERVLVAVDCAKEERLGPDPSLLEDSPFTVDIDHHHDNTRFGDVNLIVADASSTGEILSDVFRELGVEITPEIAEPLYVALVTDTGRFQYANTSPKTLRLAADLIDAGADWHKVFQTVYENVQFAKLKLLARALDRAEVHSGGRLVISHLRKNDFVEVGAAEPYSEGIIDYLRAVEGAMVAALIREPPRGDGPAHRVSLQSFGRRDRRLGDRAEEPRRRPPAGRRLLERAHPRRAQALHRRRVRACRRERCLPSGIILADKPAGPSSFDIVAAMRRRTGARTGHAGTLDPFATGLLLLLSGAATRLQPRFVGLDKRYLTEIDLSATTSTGDREGDVVEEHEPRARTSSREARLPPGTGGAPDSGRVGGEDRRRTRVPPASPGGRGRDAGAPDDRPRARLEEYAEGLARLDLLVSSGTYIRAIAEALGGHCVKLRRTEIGPFSVEEADPEWIIPPDEALARLAP